MNICCRYGPRQAKVSALSFGNLGLSDPNFILDKYLIQFRSPKKGQRYKRTASPRQLLISAQASLTTVKNKLLSNKHKIHHAFRSCKVQALRYIDLELPILVPFVRQGPMRPTPSLSKYDLPFLETIHKLTAVQSRSSYRSNWGVLNFSLALGQLKVQI